MHKEMRCYSLLSIPNLIFLLPPRLKNFQRFGELNMFDRKLSSVMRKDNLLIEHFIVKLDLGRVFPRVGEIDPVEPRPIACPQTHRTGLATRIEPAAGKGECLKLPTGVPDRFDFGVGRGVI